ASDDAIRTLRYVRGASVQFYVRQAVRSRSAALRTVRRKASGAPWRSVPADAQVPAPGPDAHAGAPQLRRSTNAAQSAAPKKPQAGQHLPLQRTRNYVPPSRASPSISFKSCKAALPGIGFCSRNGFQRVEIVQQRDEGFVCEVADSAGEGQSGGFGLGDGCDLAKLKA